MRLREVDLVSDDVARHLHDADTEFDHDVDGIHIAYPCGCKWRRLRTPAGLKPITSFLDLCFRHEVIELAARETR